MMMTSAPAEKSKQEDTLAELEAKFTIGQYGVWRVLTAKSSHHIGAFCKSTFAGIQLLRVFIVDVWHIGPALCLIVIFAQVWEGIQTSIVLYTSNRLLTSVSTFFDMIWAVVINENLDRDLPDERRSGCSSYCDCYRSSYPVHGSIVFDEMVLVSMSSASFAHQFYGGYRSASGSSHSLARKYGITSVSSFSVRIWHGICPHLKVPRCSLFESI